jgi:hypothetical protein
MADRWTDELTRRIAVTLPRRSVAPTVIGAAIAALRHVHGGQVSAGCTALRRRCHHDSQCCTLRCRRGRCRR